MKKNCLPLFLDTLFVCIISLLISFTLFRFYLNNLATSILLSISLSICLTTATFVLMRKRASNKYYISQNKQAISKLALKLALSTPQENKKLFTTLLTKQGEKVFDSNAFLLVGKEEFKAYFLRFSIEPVDADEIARIKQQCFDRKVVIMCDTLTAKAITLCKMLSYDVIYGIDIYKMLSDNQLMPDTSDIDKEVKPRFRERIKLGLKRSMCKGYLISGIMLLMLSFVTLFPLYYIIFGSILLLLSVGIRLFGQV